VKLSEIYLAFGQSRKQLVDETESMVKALLARDPNSFDGHRLTGDLSFVYARQELQKGNRDAAMKLIGNAAAEYRKADSIKPHQATVLVALGRSLASLGQVAEGEKYYVRGIEIDKSLLYAYQELYAMYIVQNRLPDAEAILRRAFTNNPKQYEFLTRLAQHYFAQRRRDDMVKTLNELKSHQKEYPQAIVTAGDFYLRLGDPEAAIREYRQGIEADPAQKPSYQKRIIEVLMRQGKRAEAAELNSAILKDNPKDNDARGLQASLMLDRGEVQKAMQDLQSVVTASPRNVVARFNLGRAHLAKGEVEQARQQFTEALQQRPDYIPARLALAQLQVVRREFDVGFKTATETLRYDPNNVPARLLQSSALIGQKKLTEARTLVESMTKAYPASSDVWFQYGLIHLTEKRFKEAEAGFQKSFDLNAANSRSLMGVIETYMAQGKGDQALARLQAESAKRPERADLYQLIGNNAVRLGKFDLALENYGKLLAKVDANSRAAADAHLRIGETYRRKGDLAKAIASLQKATQLAPDSDVAVTTLALALEGAGRADDAKRAYEQVLKLKPDHGIALNNLAFLMAETGGDLNQALTYAQRAKQRLPQIYEVSDTLGWIYLKKNLSDNAIEIFRDLVTKAPKHSTFRYHLGMALSQKGDRSNAARELQEALKHNPPQAEAVKIKELLAKLG
jgi:tetratricopeptide (TPR) repeat protein